MMKDPLVCREKQGARQRLNQCLAGTMPGQQKSGHNTTRLPHAGIEEACEN